MFLGAGGRDMTTLIPVKVDDLVFPEHIKGF